MPQQLPMALAFQAAALGNWLRCQLARAYGQSARAIGCSERASSMRAKAKALLANPDRAVASYALKGQ